MTEMVGTFAALKAQERKQRSDRREKNVALLRAHGISFRFSDDSGYTALLREEGKPEVDYYLSTDKWKVGKIIKHGNFTKFLNWYTKQSRR